MNTTLRIIILNHLNSQQKATIKLSNSNSYQTKIDLKLPFLPNGEHILLLKTEDNIYKKHLFNEINSTYNLSPSINLDKKIAVLVVAQKATEQKPVFWGGTNCVNSSECENELEFSIAQNNVLINDESTYQQEREDNNLTFENESENMEFQSTVLEDLDKQVLVDNEEDNVQQNESTLDSENGFQEHGEIDNPEIADINQVTDTPINGMGSTYIMDNINLLQNQNFDNNSCDKPQFNIIRGGKRNLNPELFEYNELEIKKEIDECLSKCEDFQALNSCASCRYKQDFYQQDKMEEARKTLAEISKMQNQQKEREIPQYYSLIEGQYNEMFERYPIYTELGQIIPNSKWLKVEMENEEYALGLIYEDGLVKYMCYGVPQGAKQIPPPELADISQWLPLDINNPNGAGLWIMYQSAETGETIKVDIV